MWNSPAPSRPSGPTDEQLSDELRKWTGGTPAVQPVGELLDRHWEAAFTYARLCTDGPGPAGMLTTAAFTRLFGETLRHHGPAFAWRPHLLVTVRRIAAEWEGDHRRASLHPDLTAASRDGTRPAALLPPPERRLLSGAFQRLPQSARCLLWHAEAESEPLDVPALLLGLDTEGARVERDRARDRLREECLQLHRELAPGTECRNYQRMLDVTCRRAHAAVDPDLAAHLDGCTHCRHTADQLSRFPDGLGTALAEAVLGWGARPYAESRARAAGPGTARVPAPGRAAEAALLGLPSRPDTGTPPPPAGLPGEGPVDGAPSSPAPRARRRTGPRPGGAPAGAGSRAARKAARRATRRRHLAAGALTVTAVVVLPLVLWSAAGSDEDTTGRDAAARPSAPAEDGRDGDGGGTSRAGAEGGAVEGALRGRLHNSASDLCVAVVGDRAAEDAETELTACSSAAVQQWTYERDGLLRNVTRPDLCLDSRLGYAVRLAACADATGGRAGSMRYDFTVRGALIPRSDQRLALAPAATDGSGALVLKNRTDDDPQRWTLDDAAPDLRMKAVTWDSEVTGPSASPAGSPVPPAAAPAPAAPAPSTTAPRPAPSGTGCADGRACAEDGRAEAGGHGYGDGGRGHHDRDGHRYDGRCR
ncbi:hypothetical protein SUDANB70_00303 [Streptomyces sp. enrichment culture]